MALTVFCDSDIDVFKVPQKFINEFKELAFVQLDKYTDGICQPTKPPNVH